MEPPHDTSESFGQYLKRERELRGIALEEIAGYTRIKLRALEAIERDDFASLPPLAFVRAFIRCYADFLGLNLPDIMLRFDAFVQNRFPELTGEIQIIPKKIQPKQRYFPLVLAIIVVLCVIFAYWIVRSPETPNPEKPSPPNPRHHGAVPAITLPPTAVALAGGHTVNPQPGETNRPPTPPPTREPATGNTASTLAPTPASGNTPFYPSLPRLRHPWTSKAGFPLGPPRELASRPLAAAAPTPQEFKHKVHISVKEKCWIQYSVDGGQPGNFYLEPDQDLVFKAVSSLKIKIGNPDAVIAVTDNGLPYPYDPQCAPWWLNFPAGPNDNQCPPP